MSLDAELVALMEPVAGAVSFAELLADPTGRERLKAFGGAHLAYSPPNVSVVERLAPGPNGPVPLRVYGPAPAPALKNTTNDAGLPAWSGCMAVDSLAVTWRCARQTSWPASW